MCSITSPASHPRHSPFERSNLCPGETAVFMPLEVKDLLGAASIQYQDCYAYITPDPLIVSKTLACYECIKASTEGVPLPTICQASKWLCVTPPSILWLLTGRKGLQLSICKTVYMCGWYATSGVLTPPRGATFALLPTGPPTCAWAPMLFSGLSCNMPPRLI
jgi:hypothetical protein